MSNREADTMDVAEKQAQSAADRLGAALKKLGVDLLVSVHPTATLNDPVTFSTTGANWLAEALERR